MFDRVTDFIEKYLQEPMTKLSTQRHLRAVRDGIIATLPIIIVSSMFLVIAFLPNQLPADWTITQWLSENAGKILLPYRMSMYIMTPYAVFGIGYSLTRSYKLDELSGAIISVLAYLLTIVPLTGPAAPEELLELAETTPVLSEYINSVPQGFLLPMGNLGAGGMFVGIISAIIAVEIYRWSQVKGFKISMPEQVPPSVARSFEALVPTAIVLLLFATVTMWLEIDVHGLIGQVVAPLVTATDTLPSVLIITFLGMLFWTFGIHGWNIVGTIARPLWLILLDENTAAYAAGEEIPNIGAEPLYQWFINIGGSGATIGLAILFAFFSRSAYLKTLGKTSFLPAVFNINEPMVFGAPIVLNPMLMIPFIITPLVLGTISWFATSLGLINPVVTLAPWTLPGPIGAYFATGGDWRAVVLNVLLIVLSTAMYYPFFRIYDNNLKREEEGQPMEDNVQEAEQEAEQA